MVFERLENSFRELSSDIEQIIVNVLIENEKFIIALIRSQLNRGLKSDGKITPYYSQQYAKKKGRKIPNLKVTGEFYDNINLEGRDTYILVSSQRENKGFDVAEYLEKRYGKEIYELSVESIKVIRDKVTNQIKNEINKLLR